MEKNNLDEILASPIIEGRKSLAQAMVEPIKISLKYQGIGRRLLRMGDLSSGPPGIRKIGRVVEPFIEIEDYTSEEYWPEWNVDYYGGSRAVVKAPTEQAAAEIAKDGPTALLSP